jgi:hypothetical protein
VDVKEQGLLWLFLRVKCLGERQRVRRLYDRWVEQVKFTEAQLEKVHDDGTDESH